MDSYEVDLFLTCLIGGFCGGASLMLIMRYHFRMVYKQYQKAKDVVADSAALRRAEFEIEQLKVKVATLDREIYTQHDQEAN